MRAERSRAAKAVLAALDCRVAPLLATGGLRSTCNDHGLDAGLEHVAAAADGVEEAGLAGVGFDLAAQAGDLDVDGALASASSIWSVSTMVSRDRTSPGRTAEGLEEGRLRRRSGARRHPLRPDEARHARRSNRSGAEMERGLRGFGGGGGAVRRSMARRRRTSS